MSHPAIHQILIVDDQPELRMLTRLTLREDGLNIREEECGEAALLACRELPPDIVLLDVMLPGINGHEVCRQIKSDPRCAHSIVILMTAADQATERMRGAASGADHYVAKPFSPTALQQLVRKILTKVGQ